MRQELITSHRKLSQHKDRQFSNGCFPQTFFLRRTTWQISFTGSHIIFLSGQRNRSETWTKERISKDKHSLHASINNTLGPKKTEAGFVHFFRSSFLGRTERGSSYNGRIETRDGASTPRSLQSSSLSVSTGTSSPDVSVTWTLRLRLIAG